MLGEFEQNASNNNLQEFTKFHQNNLNEEFKKYCKKNAEILLENHPDNLEINFSNIKRSLELNKPANMIIEQCNDSLQKICEQISKISNYGINLDMDLFDSKYEEIILKIATNAKNVLIYMREICENNYACLQNTFETYETFENKVKNYVNFNLKNNNFSTRNQLKDFISNQRKMIEDLNMLLEQNKGNSMTIWNEKLCFYEYPSLEEDSLEMIQDECESKQQVISKYIKEQEITLLNSYINTDAKRLFQIKSELNIIKEFIITESLEIHNQYVYHVNCFIIRKLSESGLECIEIFKKSYRSMEITYYVKFIMEYVLPYYKSSMNRIWSYFDSSDSHESFFLKVFQESKNCASYYSFLDKLENWTILMWSSGLEFIESEVNNYCGNIIENCQFFKLILKKLINFCEACKDIKQIDTKKLKSMEELSITIKDFKQDFEFAKKSQESKVQLHKKISQQFSTCISILNELFEKIDKIKKTLEDYEMLFLCFKTYYDKFIKYKESIFTSHNDYVMKTVIDQKKTSFNQRLEDNLSNRNTNAIRDKILRSNSNPQSNKRQQSNDIFRIKIEEDVIAENEPDGPSTLTDRFEKVRLRQSPDILLEQDPNVTNIKRLQEKENQILQDIMKNALNFNEAGNDFMSQANYLKYSNGTTSLKSGDDLKDLNNQKVMKKILSNYSTLQSENIETVMKVYSNFCLQNSEKLTEGNQSMFNDTKLYIKSFTSSLSGHLSLIKKELENHPGEINPKIFKDFIEIRMFGEESIEKLFKAQVDILETLHKIVIQTSTLLDLNFSNKKQFESMINIVDLVNKCIQIGEEAENQFSNYSYLNYQPFMDQLKNYIQRTGHGAIFFLGFKDLESLTNICDFSQHIFVINSNHETMIDKILYACGENKEIKLDKKETKDGLLELNHGFFIGELNDQFEQIAYNCNIYLEKVYKPGTVCQQKGTSAEYEKKVLPGVKKENINQMKEIIEENQNIFRIMIGTCNYLVKREEHKGKVLSKLGQIQEKFDFVLSRKKFEKNQMLEQIINKFYKKIELYKRCLLENTS